MRMNSWISRIATPLALECVRAVVSEPMSFDRKNSNDFFFVKCFQKQCHELNVMQMQWPSHIQNAGRCGAVADIQFSVKIYGSHEDIDH